MNMSPIETIHHTFAASNAGSIHFGQVIGQLMGAGVESYHVDYRSGRSTYYLADGSYVDCRFETPAHAIAEAFDGDAVKAAIVAAQRGEVMYPEFKKRSQAAGCAAYTVWIAGRHVVYMGRRGETHVERFPN